MRKLTWGFTKALDLAQCRLRKPGSTELIGSFDAAIIDPRRSSQGPFGSLTYMLRPENPWQRPLLLQIAEAPKIVFSEPQQLADALRIAFQVVGGDRYENYLNGEERAGAKTALRKLVALLDASPQGPEVRQLLLPTLDQWVNADSPKNQALRRALDKGLDKMASLAGVPPEKKDAQPERDYGRAYLNALREAGYFDRQPLSTLREQPKRLDLSQCRPTEAEKPGRESFLARVANATEIVFSKPQQLVDAIQAAFQTVGRNSVDRTLSAKDRVMAEEALKRLVALSETSLAGPRVRTRLYPIVKELVETPELPAGQKDYRLAYLHALREAGYFDRVLSSPVVREKLEELQLQDSFAAFDRDFISTMEGYKIESAPPAPPAEEKPLTPAQQAIKNEVEWELRRQFPNRNRPSSPGPSAERDRAR